MNADNLKKILKPLIKQCIREVIFEEGALSGIIKEVATGLSDSAKIVTEKKSGEKSLRLEESKQRMLESIGRDAYKNVDLFEGTSPLPSKGTPGASSPSSPLSNIDPTDAGVDIGGIFGQLSENWKKMV